MQSIYGVLDKNDCHIDISLSIKGAKRVATKNGYKTVSKRNDYNVTPLFVKRGKAWVNYE